MHSPMPVSPAEDSSRLMLAAARGDADAWTMLCSTHEPWMQRALRGRIPSHLRARFDESDVMQEALLSLCAASRVLESGDPAGLRRFLGKVLQNGLRDEVRRHHRGRRNARREGPGSGPGLDLQPCRAPLPLEEALWRDLCEQLEDELERLPSEDRELLRRRFVEDETWIEIAERLGLSEPTARRRGTLALERLRRLRA